MSLKDLSSSLGSQQVKQKPKTFDTKAQTKTIPATNYWRYSFQMNL